MVIDINYEKITIVSKIFILWNKSKKFKLITNGK